MQRQQLPDGWAWTTIGQVARTASGGTPSRTRADFYGVGIPWVKSGELGDGQVFETSEQITEAGLQNSSARIFPKGTLCIALYGATVGKLGVLGMDAATNQAVCGIFLPDGLDRTYVFHYLASMRRWLIDQGKGGAQPNISQEIVRAVPLPLPPPAEQRRIVEKIEELFSKLDAGVAALERVRANLKRYRASLLKAAVEGKLTEQWRADHPDAEPASELLQRILAERRRQWEEAELAKYAAKGQTPPKNWQAKYKEPEAPDTTDLPELPKGWCWTSVEQLNPANRPCAYGVLQPGDDLADGVPLVRVMDVADGRVAVDQLKRISPDISGQYRRTVLHGGEVLLTIVGTIGRTAVAPPELLGANIARAVAVLPIATLVSAQYVEVTLRDPCMRVRLTNAAHEVARKTLNLEDVRVAPVPLCPTDEQTAIVNEVERRLSVIDEMDAEAAAGLKRAARLRQSILKRAFEGRLVPQDPNDVPAHVLLER